MPQLETATVGPKATPRTVIDPSRKCALRCEFCYYLPQDDFYSVRQWEDVEREVLAARERGCDRCDITGGEPLQYPDIVRLVRLCADVGLRPRVITSLIGSEKVIDELLDGGIDDWLISMHGLLPSTHDQIVKVPRAREFQIRRLQKISAVMRYCCNYVMIARNQEEIASWAGWLLSAHGKGMFARLPRIVNFINFNPHYDWVKMRDKAMANIVDLSVAGPLLDTAIDDLEAAGIGVNVRYFPMCALAERNRKNVCNDLHVAYDTGEWDNAFAGDKSESAAYAYGAGLSLANEEKGEPCSSCDLQWVCGGANTLWHRMNREKHGEQLVPLTSTPLAGSKDFWHYRRDNSRAMA